MSGQGHVGDQLWQQVYVGDKLASAVYLGTNHIWGPQVGDPIDFIEGSLGTARNASTGTNKSAIGTMSIPEDDFDRFAVAYVAISHDNWINSVGAYGTFTLTSHLDGPFTRLDTALFGRGGNASRTSRQGSVTPFVLRNPTVGLHTVTAFCSPSQWINCIEFQVMAYKNVLAVSSVNVQITDTANYLTLPKACTVNDVTLCGVAHDRLTLSGFSYPQRGSTLGGSVKGRADYLTVLEAGLGHSPFVTFESTTQAILGAAALNLIGYPQS